MYLIAEIYRIVSQKQIRDPPEGDVIRPTNVEAIDVKPTVSADSVRKQCCQWPLGERTHWPHFIFIILVQVRIYSI